MEPSIQLYTHVNLNFSHEKFTCYNTFSKLMCTRTRNKKLIKLQNHLQLHEQNFVDTQRSYTSSTWVPILGTCSADCLVLVILLYIFP